MEKLLPTKLPLSIKQQSFFFLLEHHENSQIHQRPLFLLTHQSWTPSNWELPDEEANKLPFANVTTNLISGDTMLYRIAPVYTGKVFNDIKNLMLS